MEDWIKNYLRLPLWGKFEWMINVAPPEDENMTESVSSEENEAVF